MNTLMQKFLSLFSTTVQEPAADAVEAPETDGMPLASAAYLREFAHRLGLEVDDLSPAEQTELKARLDESMDFREENYGTLYHRVYKLGHGYSLADAQRVSAALNDISAEAAARAYLDYRENAVAAEALMAAGTLLQKEGEIVAAERLFTLAETRRHRSSLLGTARVNGTEMVDTDLADLMDSPEDEAHDSAVDADLDGDGTPGTENDAKEGPAKEDSPR